jgi:dynein heavy chain
VHDQKLPVSDNFDFATFLANPTDVRDWNIQGLPKDDFSTENGVISTRGNRWPLMIDPQGQANRWIRNMEGARLRIIDLKMTGFLQQVEASIQYGFPVLLQDILEEIDPALEPVLSKSILKIGNREVLRLGDKELDYSRDFRMYITTKLSNPHYTPEISTKATVVNFAVKKDGLEAQLLGIVFAKEEPKLEKKKGELTIMVANNKRTLVELEDMILKLLSESTGSLLDDVELVDTLQKSKITSEEVTQQLISAEETEKQIDGTRTGYKAAAVRASLVYFVMDDMSRVDPMYQFSLDSYVDLFNNSMDNSHMTSLDITSEKRCFEINTYHTLSVYQYTCRALFERHKLLFSFQLCIKIMEAKGDIVEEEYAFFCYGSGLSDRSMQKNNPGADWLPNTVWDAVNDLDKIGGFSGIVASFEQMPRDWKAWYMSGKPEVEPMPSDWSTKTSELQKLCIVRACRLDRVLFAAAKFVQANIGQEFVEPPSFDLGEVYKKSNNKTPLIFVLSPGVDPTAGIMQLASQLETHMDNCALGQGQEVTATRLLETGLKQGNWVFLANCHLMLSWMPALEKIIEAFVEGDPHPNFRLWLSSSPDPNFPITILQRGLKMTTEPPRGLRSNMLTLFNTISDDQFMRCGNPIVYRKLLFCLAWFHAILLERRKFKSLGFNIPYDFNGSDFDICHDLVIVFLDEYPDRIPFDAMKYLIAEANYGGRVTDDWDRRLVNVYIAELFCDECVQSETFPLSDLPDYMVPHDPGAALTLRQYKDLIKGMPPTDHPLAFGQHSNSDMAASIDDAATLIDTLVSLQPRMAQVVDDEAGDPLARQCQELLETTPELFDAKDVRERMEVRTDPDPLKTVLFQEVDRYNKLLGSLRSSLSTIIKVQNGTASTTVELEEVILGLQQLKVPRSWGKTYPSVKPLGPWMKDVVTRIEFFNSWINDNLPATWWLPAMTFPTGFLTAVLQVSARANAVSIDSLIFETPVLTTMNNAEIRQPARDGVFIYGIYLEGATWNVQHGILEESRPMELISHMPVIHFKPVEGRRRTAKGYYTCPLYMYPVRTGTRERPSYVSSVDLKVGKQSSDYWTKRGVAMLLSIAS